MIRPIQPGWVPYLKDIDIKSYEYPWLEEWTQLNSYVIRGAIRQDKVVAFYAVKPGVTCMIHKLAVRPNFRGQGVGKELLSYLEKECEEWKLKVIEALLHEENVNGLNWAHRQGFKAVGIKLRYFPDDRDGIELRKEL